MSYDVDLFVIGGGSGGVRAARTAAATGAKVALAEDSRMGGTCVIRGCVPKKLLSYAAHFHEDFEDAAGFGWTVPDPTFEWSKLATALHAELDRLEGIYHRLLDGAGVTLFEGRGVLRKGAPADIVVYDYENLKVLPGEIVHDLPAGGPRLEQRAEGYLATVVSGAVTYQNGEATGALPGRLIRKV